MANRFKRGGGGGGGGDGGDGGDGGGGGDGPGGLVAGILSEMSLRTFLGFFLGTGTVAMLVGSESDPGLLTSPKKFVLNIVKDWLYTAFLKPVGEALYNGLFAFINGITLLFYGGDHQLGIQHGTTVGILDLPFLISGPIADAYRDIGTTIVSGIEAVNQPFIEGIASLGVAAPVASTVVAASEIAILGWTVWIAVNAIDVPGVRVMSVIRTAYRPVYRFIKWLL